MSVFFRRLEEKIKEKGTRLCVGLDPRQEEMTFDEQDMLRYDPTIGLFQHGKRIFDATHEVASSWKINLAFYEAWGSGGWAALEKLIPILSSVAPVLLDGKRGDIGGTASSYATSAAKLGAQAVTVSPYLGKDSILPFMERGLDVFMLVRTSNPSSGDIQDQPAAFPTWKRVLDDAMKWSSSEQLGFVVGATDIHILKNVRSIAPDRWILAPGVGAQGAKAEDVVRVGGSRLLIPISRAISGSPDPHHAAAQFADETKRVVDERDAKVVTTKERVANELYDRGCVKFGQFKLKSGVVSPIYVDLRSLISHPDLLAQVAELYKEVLKNESFDVLAALPYAALPIGTAISLTMGKPMIYPRRERKEHGTCSLIEGEWRRGTRAVVIDDVITRGDSKFEAISRLENEGIVAYDVCVLIDREGGGRESLHERGKKLISIFRFTDLLDVWLRSGRISQRQYGEVVEFLART